MRRIIIRKQKEKREIHFFIEDDQEPEIRQALLTLSKMVGFGFEIIKMNRQA